MPVGDEGWGHHPPRLNWSTRPLTYGPALHFADATGAVRIPVGLQRRSGGIPVGCRDGVVGSLWGAETQWWGSRWGCAGAVVRIRVGCGGANEVSTVGRECWLLLFDIRKIRAGGCGWRGRDGWAGWLIG